MVMNTKIIRIYMYLCTCTCTLLLPVFTCLYPYIDINQQNSGKNQSQNFVDALEQ